MWTPWRSNLRRDATMRAALMTVLVSSCGPASAPVAAPPDPPRPSTPVTDPGPTTTEPAVPEHDAMHTVALSGEAAHPVPGTPLTASVVDGYHKIGAPVVGVSVLVELAGEPPQRAQVGWQIESDQIDHTWRALAGRRWDAATSAYVEEQIPGWLVRLESLDGQSAGGTPEAITVTFKRAP